MFFVERVVIVVYAVDLIFNEQRFCKPLLPSQRIPVGVSAA
jgi:hypothetical protein